MQRPSTKAGTRLLAACAALPAAGLTQPPPPPPPGFPDYVHILDEAYNKRDLAAYAAPFAADVQVDVDGVVVARDRDALISRTREEFGQGLTIHPISSAQGEQVIAFEMVVGCVPDHPDPRIVYHGCPTMRAVRYDLGPGGRIVGMHILAARAWNIHSEPRDWWEF